MEWQQEHSTRGDGNKKELTMSTNPRHSTDDQFTGNCPACRPEPTDTCTGCGTEVTDEDRPGYIAGQLYCIDCADAYFAAIIKHDKERIV